MNLLMKICLQVFFLNYLTISIHGWFFNIDDRADVLSGLERFKDLEESGSEGVSDVSLTSDEAEQPNHEVVAADLFSTILREGLGLPHGLSFLKSTVKQPWWKGERVCISKVEQVTRNNETDETMKPPFIFLGNAAFSTCRNTLNKYICTTKMYTRDNVKTTEIIYQCCPGSRKNHENELCEHVDVKTLSETAKALGSAEFADVIQSTVKKSVSEAPNMTIFIPSDNAIDAYMNALSTTYLNEKVVHAVPLNTSSDESAENEIPTVNEKIEKKSSRTKKAVSSERALNHFVSGIHDIHDLENEQILTTVDGLPIRVNIYHGEKRPIITANCAAIKSANHPIQNGSMLHVTDAVLPQITKSIRDLLLESNDFKTFSEFAASVDLMEKLGQEGNYTVFVFTDAAFAKLDDEMKIQLKAGKSCIKTMMKAHIIPRTLCEAAFGSLTVMTRSISGNWLTIEKSDNNTLLVSRESETSSTDIVANNGVIHLIDRPIVPKSAQPISSLLTDTNQTKWLELMTKAGLIDDFQDAVNRTIFVPTEEAIKKARLEEVENDKLREIMSLHISDKSFCSCQMKNNLMISTLVPDQELRVTTYETSGALFVGLDPKIMVQCASIINKDEQACDTMVHEVDRVITPTKNTIFENIYSDPALSPIRKILENTTLHDELKNGSMGPITFLAPTAEAFSKLESADWKMLEDRSVADELLRRHIITDVVCCNGIGMSSWPFSEEVNTANGFSMNVRRKNATNVIFGDTMTESCDHLTKDGLIHYVDKVMMPRPISLKGSAVKYVDPNGSEIVLFGI